MCVIVCLFCDRMNWLLKVHTLLTTADVMEDKDTHTHKENLGSPSVGEDNPKVKGEQSAHLLMMYFQGYSMSL